MDLQESRQQIDRIDREIIRLYQERMDVMDGVAEYKIGHGMKVYDKDREQKKIALARSMVRGEANQHGVEELFQSLMTTSRKKQYQIMAERGKFYRMPFIEVEKIRTGGNRVVYQGAPGSYSEAAMKKFFGDEVDNFAVQTFRDAMVVIEEGGADYAVLPIENSTAGIVSQIYDLLMEFENYIVGEEIIPIEHCLMAPEGASLESIRRVYSHAQSLMQSEHFLYAHPHWEQISMQNNAFAAQKVAKEGDPEQAAIASEYAAKTYGLHILERGVNQSDSNSTRFIIVTNQKIFPRRAKKVSLCLEVLHESGSLYHLLSHFIYNGLNMTKIESRPIEDRTWEYRFFIDFDGNLKDPAVRNALRGLRDEARSLRILGNY